LAEEFALNFGWAVAAAVLGFALSAIFKEM
jgi:hypothetical protein